jgi:hypothetical protein
MPNGAFKKDRKRGAGRKLTNKDHVSKFAGDAYSLASRAVAGVNAIRKLINIETKFADYNINGFVTTTPTVLYASALTQGVDVSNRVGDSIRLQGLSYAFRVTGDPTAAVYSSVRLLIVRDNENVGATPAVTDILVSQSVTSSLNWFTTSRFNVLLDEVVGFVANTGSLTDFRRGTISQHGHVKFRGTSNAVGSAAEGSIFILAFSNVVALPPSLLLDFRVTYTDD